MKRRNFIAMMLGLPAVAAVTRPAMVPRYPLLIETVEMGQDGGMVNHSFYLHNAMEEAIFFEGVRGRVMLVNGRLVQ